MLFQEEYERVSLACPLTQNEAKVLMICWTRCIYGGEVPLTQSEMASILHIGAAEVSRALRTLVRGGYILRERGGRRKKWRYQLPTTLCHRGALDELAYRRFRDTIRIHAQQLSEKPEDS
jgi:DNA-binding MarR family transcriptional regulator